jgi:hypothetical protein
MILMAIARCAFAPVALSWQRITALTVPLIVCACRGPITQRAIARWVGLVVPVASALVVIVVLALVVDDL